MDVFPKSDILYNSWMVWVLLDVSYLPTFRLGLSWPVLASGMPRNLIKYTLRIGGTISWNTYFTPNNSLFWRNYVVWIEIGSCYTFRLWKLSFSSSVRHTGCASWMTAIENWFLQQRWEYKHETFTISLLSSNDMTCDWNLIYNSTNYLVP